MAAELAAAIAALDALASQGGAAGTSSAILRFSQPQAAALVAGTWAPTPLATLRGAVLSKLLTERRRRGGRLWIAGWRDVRACIWGARALALAQYGRKGRWGATPPTLAPVRPAPPLPPDRGSCSVCYEDYDVDFPTPGVCFPCPRERWGCPRASTSHFVCGDCDAACQAAANNKCPECRADRVVFLV